MFVWSDISNMAHDKFQPSSSWRNTNEALSEYLYVNSRIQFKSYNTSGKHKIKKNDFVNSYKEHFNFIYVSPCFKLTQLSTLWDPGLGFLSWEKEWGQHASYIPQHFRALSTSSTFISLHSEHWGKQHMENTMGQLRMKGRVREPQQPAQCCRIERRCTTLRLLL